VKQQKKNKYTGRDTREKNECGKHGDGGGMGTEKGWVNTGDERKKRLTAH
jgi:hypothetical protein